MPKKIIYQEGDIIGNYGISYIKDVDKHICNGGHTERKAKFICHCGKEFESRIKKIKTNAIKSCGCKYIIHGKKKHPAYSTWKNMHQRCEKTESYINKNILVCWEWNRINPEGIHNFCEWWDSINPEQDLTIERTNNNADYSPNNCIFDTRFNQAHNRGIYSTNKSGYVGVSFNTKKHKWQTMIKYKGKQYYLGRFKNINDAVESRNNYIRENNLQHLYQIQEY